MDEMDQGAAVAGSPPADVSAGNTPPGAQPGQPAQPTAEPPFHQHPRFQQLIGENRNLKSTVAEMQRSVAEMQRLQQQAQSGAGLSQDEQKQYSEAAQALKKILAADPELKEMFESRSKISKLEQGYQGVQQLSQAQAAQQQRQTFTHIEQLAKSANLPTDKASLSRLFRLVVTEAQSIPEAEERYARGDLSLFDDAFKAINEGFIGQFRRDAAAPVLAAKTKTRNLPPAPRGGMAGSPAPEKPVEGKEREYERSMFNRAKAMLGG